MSAWQSILQPGLFATVSYGIGNYEFAKLPL